MSNLNRVENRNINYPVLKFPRILYCTVTCTASALCRRFHRLFAFYVDYRRRSLVLRLTTFGAKIKSSQGKCSSIFLINVDQLMDLAVVVTA